ncbi:glycosyltransferase family 2 protein [Hoeflea sp. TYP-13]|uniref:glycosyltransferase family 2 protein n=1 Tax=Hoeflea sp. TYP-13 TaxID=3230023 RepID=UPI0034C6BF26
MQSRIIKNPAKIAVLMAVYNGERFLQQQVDSLSSQGVPSIDVWVSDDGSSDGSRKILKSCSDSWSKGTFRVADGPQTGFSDNFRSLMSNTEIQADYYAFCDQDDLWDSDKLQVALSQLASLGRDMPALYCGRTRIVDECGRHVGYSPLFDRQPNFRNAIVQSIAGGNTMVANRAAWQLLAESARRTDFVSHDWWCYILVAGAGGRVVYDPQAHISYRQHSGNLVGDNMSLRSRIDRVNRLFKGQFVSWGDRNLSSLQQCIDLLSDDAKATVEEFRSFRAEKSIIRRLRGLLSSGIYRQSLQGNLGLFAATLFQKL